MSRRYHLRTFGCQMNQHDAEKIENLLHHEGYRPTGSAQAADLILVHTCSVRDKAEKKLYSELGTYAPLKRARPELGGGVGGCVAQQEGGGLLKRFGGLDFVFGPQNLHRIPEMVYAARQRERTLRVDYDEAAEARFELPELHPEFATRTPGRAYVTVMEGCDLFCSFCVVPMTRGREVSRSSAEILAEVAQRARQGAVEVTLLGQTVNAYGRKRPGMARDEIPFSELIRRVAGIEGIERIRFTSPHPIFATQDLIDCYRDVPELCPHLHLPVQSGSDRMLAAMNRRYTRAEYLQIVRELRQACPDLALTSDLIVGFPGESEADFEATLELVEDAQFVDSFSFKYSPRPGTAAVRKQLELVEPAQAQERLERLQGLQRALSLADHRRQIGTRVDVLVEGESRRGSGQLTGRSGRHRIVNFESAEPIEPGRFASVQITGATPHSMLGTTAQAAPSQELDLA